MAPAVPIRHTLGALLGIALLSGAAALVTTRVRPPSPPLPESTTASPLASRTAAGPVVPQALIQAQLDAAPSGSTVTLAPGRYQGPLHITHPLTLDGRGQATIEGDGHSTVLTVEADDVTVRGLILRGSGDSQDRLDAGLQLQGTRLHAEDNRMEDVLFGLHLKSVSHSVVARNRVLGKALDTGLRGDALRLWNSRDNRVEDNVFERGRDLTLINSPDNRLLRNRFTDGRYGLHAVFSPRLHAEGNSLDHTGTGVVALYSPNLSLQGNRIAHALTDGGAAIVLKESSDSRVEGNEVLHCGVGLKLDTGQEGRERLVVRGNRFAHNIVGMFFYGEAGGDRFIDNRFDNNLTTVAVSAPGAGAAHVWLGNQWDEYQGFDRNHDGLGDTPHEVLVFSDRIWMENPMATFFRNSPALELLDLLERLAPFTSPYRILKDPQPRMVPPPADPGLKPPPPAR